MTASFRARITGVRTGRAMGGARIPILALWTCFPPRRKVPLLPFGISFFADPAGSFTTAAAMVACVEKSLLDKKKRKFEGPETRGLRCDRRGRLLSPPSIAALEGADVTLVGYDGTKRVSEAASEIKARFQVDVHVADGSDDTKKAEILAEAEAALCAGRAGVRILSSAQLAQAKRLQIVADVNAVPPSGVEGLDMMANGVGSLPTARSALVRVDHWHQVQDRIRLVPAHDRRDETGDLRAFAMHSSSRAS